MAKKEATPKDTLERALILAKEGKDHFLHASERTDNELAKRTFQTLSARHDRHAERMELAGRALERQAVPEIEPPTVPRPLFEEIMRRIEQSTSPTARNFNELRESIVYATKLRDVYAHLAHTAAEEWETRLYSGLRDDEEALKLTLADTLNYLRSNFELSQVPKAEA